MSENNTKNQNLNECLNYLYTQIGKYSKTKKGYTSKLYEKGFSSLVINQAIAIAEQKKFIDDDAFAQSYINRNKNKKGTLKLKSELIIKGVDQSIIEKYLNEIEEDEQAYALAEKFLKGKEIDINTISKLYRHLCGKGFSYETVTNTIYKIKNSADI